MIAFMESAWEESLRVTWFDEDKHQVFGCRDKKKPEGEILV